MLVCKLDRACLSYQDEHYPLTVLCQPSDRGNHSLFSLVITPQFDGWPVCLKALNYTCDPLTALVATQEQLLDMLLHVRGIMLVMLFSGLHITSLSAHY